MNFKSQSELCCLTQTWLTALVSRSSMFVTVFVGHTLKTSSRPDWSNFITGLSPFLAFACKYESRVSIICPQHHHDTEGAYATNHLLVSIATRRRYWHVLRILSSTAHVSSCRALFLGEKIVGDIDTMLRRDGGHPFRRFSCRSLLDFVDIIYIWIILK